MNSTNVITATTAFSLSTIFILTIIRLKKNIEPTELFRESAINHICKQVTVSSPGKALIAGGYAVLEAPNVAVTIAVSARFYVTSETMSNGNTPSISNDLEVFIESPQFHSSYEYGYILSKDECILISEQGNNFVEKCMVLVFKFAKEFFGHQLFGNKLSSIRSSGKLHVVLRADNDFYSQVSKLRDMEEPLLSSSLQKLPKFLPCPIDSSGKVIVAKTGMGSSASLTTSLVGSLLHYLGVVDLGGIPTIEDLRIVHNVAQLAHSIAQGKIGSGFDVSAAVYGSQIFVRFSADKLSQCLEPSCSSKVIYSSIIDHSLWTQVLRPFELPRRLRLVMGDVCCGAESSSMAKKVLDWKNRSDQVIWNDLATSNAAIASHFEEIVKISQNNEDSYDEFIDWAESRTPKTWSHFPNGGIALKFLELKNQLTHSRKLLRTMGQLAEVAIEPIEQTLLADATESVHGVLCAAVPGAGGRDALYCIALSDDSVQRVETLWSQWSLTHDVSVCPLTLQAAPRGEGIRVEDLQ